MDDLDKLPSDLVWQHDGHVSDVVLSSIADGEVKIVPLEALSHLEQCDHCTTRFGAEALLSMHAGELMAELSRSMRAPALLEPHVAVVSSEKRNPVVLPKRAIVAALVLAAFGAMPGLMAGYVRIGALVDTIGRSILMLSRGMVLVAKSESFTALVWSASLILLVSGFVVSRFSHPSPANDLAEEGGV